MTIELDAETRSEATAKLKSYLRDELNVEVGGFDAEFLLDFFAKEVGYRFYNQGLADALQALRGKVDEFADVVYELERQSPE